MDYLSEKLLLEQPHVFLDMDEENDDDIIWDFCAEDKPKSWIVQLVTMYAMKRLITINKRKNQKKSIALSDEVIKKFTDNLTKDPFFLIQARKCVEDLVKDKKFKTLVVLRKFLPENLKKSLGIDTVSRAELED